MKAPLKALLLGSMLLGVSCGKKETAGGETDSGGVAVVEKAGEETVVADLGFASRVPADSDFFFAAYYDGGELVGGMMESMLKYGSMTKEDLVREEDGKTHEEQLEEAAGYLGSEVFVFSGPGVGDKLTMVGTTYRELSAAWGGFVVGAMLDAIAEDGKELDMDKLGEGVSEDLSGRWQYVIESESRLLVPSVVAGWHPDEARRDGSRDACAEMLDGIFKEEEGAEPVSFESHGAVMTGYEVKGTEVFGEMIEEMRSGISEQAEEMTYGAGLSAERLERFLVALEEVKFTVATGIIDGRVLVYFGDGKEGFQLAGTPGESLAAKEELRWIASPPGKRLVAAGYLSEKMVGCVLPWLDSSKYWESIAKAVRAPIKEQGLMRELLQGMAAHSKILAQRDVSAWSAAAYTGDGWTLLTRGGIVDPSIDFEAPLRMTDAVSATKPAFRGHWVQRRDWNDLSWEKLESMGFILEAVGKELGGAYKDELEAIPGGSGLQGKVISTVRDLNRAYRDEFRSGIGDEVAVFGDFLGEMPPIPGISEETVRDFTVPRFVYARPVTDRAMVSKAGETSVGIWKDLIAYANGFGDGGIPLILPQSIESGGLVTWYAPLPFIGGDFVPGVTVGDNLWMAGTSRSLAGDLAKGLGTGSGSAETGVLVEVDFDAMEVWLRALYQKGKEEAESVAGEEIERMDKSAAGLLDGLSELKSLKYRRWLESGKPRTSIEVAFDDE
jgi:hypothetical protein